MSKKWIVQVVHDDEQEETDETNRKTKEGNQKVNLRENINSKRDKESVKPQQRDHSKRLR